MKKTIFTITAIGVLGVLACSNEKDPQPAPKSRFELLTAHTWKFASQTDSSGKDIPFEKCEKDDLMSFKSDYSFEINDGTDTCTGGEISTRANTWALQSNDTKIYLNRPNVTSAIISLDENTLVLKDDQEKIVTKLSK